MFFFVEMRPGVRIVGESRGTARHTRAVRCVRGLIESRRVKA